MDADFAERLTQAREARGWSRHEAAAAASMLLPTYFRLESGGRANPSWRTICRLVDGGLGLEWFFPPEAIAAAAERLAQRNEKGAADVNPRPL